MGKLGPFLLACVPALTLIAQERIPVQQLQEIVSTAPDIHDASLARRLSGLQLTERLSSSRLAEIGSRLPGPQSKRQLSILADSSAFLPLPPDEIPALPPLDHPAQAALLNSARDFIGKTLRKLPNFFADRQTASFQGEPRKIGANSLDMATYKNFEEVNSSTITVLYRDGQELLAKGKRFSASSRALHTVGEFGPILSMVWNDFAKTSLRWSHWEQFGNNRLAVFDFAVPASDSHYSVVFPGLQPESQHYPAYHGQISIQSVDGSIRRLVLIADLDPNDALSSAALAVEYDSTDIGGQTYICPVKSIALATFREISQSMDAQWNGSKSLGDPHTFLNEVLFTHYHIFRSESRLLTDAASAESYPKVLATPPPAPPSPQTLVEKAFFIPGPKTQFNIADFEQALAKAKSDDLSDSALIPILQSVRLTERLNSTRFLRLESEFSSPRVREALTAIADASAFLEVPEIDVLEDPEPDASVLSSLRKRLLDYSKRTRAALLKVAAERQMLSFEDVPAQTRTPYFPLHLVSSSKSSVSNHESEQPGDFAKYGPTPASLADDMLHVVQDAAKSELWFDHWEKESSGNVVVFSYSAPGEISSLKEVTNSSFPLQWREKADIGDLGVPYYGQIAVNPSDGAIVRLTAISELNSGAPVTRAGFVVECSPIRLGDARFMSPTRRLVVELRPFSDAKRPSTVQAHIEDISFSAFQRGSSR